MVGAAGRGVGGGGASRHGVGPQVDLGGDGERGRQVGHQALPRHERLDLGGESGEVLLGRAPQDVAVALVGQAEDEERVELAEQLAVDQLGLLGNGDEADLELAPLASEPGEDVGLAVAGRGQHALGLLEHDGDHRHRQVPLGVVEVRGGPLLEHTTGEERRHQQLLGAVEAAGVDEHDLAVLKLAHDRVADAHVASRH